MLLERTPQVVQLPCREQTFGEQTVTHVPDELQHDRTSRMLGRIDVDDWAHLHIDETGITHQAGYPPSNPEIDTRL
jgi:hypothetical protein